MNILILHPRVGIKMTDHISLECSCMVYLLGTLLYLVQENFHIAIVMWYTHRWIWRLIAINEVRFLFMLGL
jgi:hypothetical protein